MSATLKDTAIKLIQKITDEKHELADPTWLIVDEIKSRTEFQNFTPIISYVYQSITGTDEFKDVITRSTALLDKEHDFVVEFQTIKQGHFLHFIVYFVYTPGVDDVFIFND